MVARKEGKRERLALLEGWKPFARCNDMIKCLKVCRVGINRNGRGIFMAFDGVIGEERPNFRK